MYLRYS
jgi:hypothetical protein